MAVTVFRMSQISMTMVEGRVVKWLKAEGDAVTEGEAFLEIETDKIVVEVTAPATGLLRKILVEEGDYAQVGEPVCLIADASDDISGFLGEGTEALQIGQPVEAAATVQEQAPPDRVKISPLAKRIALRHDLDYTKLAGSGPAGLIVKADIEKSLAEPAPPRDIAPAAIANKPSTSPQADIEAEIIPFKGMRRRIADNLTLSKQNAADVTTVMDVDMTNVAAYRKVLPVSYTAFVVRAAAKALPDFPMLNASIAGDSIHIKKQVNICVAVATGTGLVTPVIRDTNKKNILTVAEEMDELALKSREGTLSSDDFAGGTFTVTNSGTFGSLLFTPIINYPQCAILGIGKVAPTPIVRDGEIVAAPVMYLCLTYDHRIVDGETAVKFLKTVKTYLEKPEQMLK